MFARFSWLQALGFLILVGGTLTFNVGDERLHKERMNSNQHQERDINVIQQDTILSHAQTDPVIVPIASNSGMALPYMGGPTQRPSLLCTASLIPTPSSIPTVHASESHLSASRISMYYNSIGSSITSSYWCMHSSTRQYHVYVSAWWDAIFFSIYWLIPWYNYIHQIWSLWTHSDHSTTPNLNIHRCLKQLVFAHPPPMTHTNW